MNVVGEVQVRKVGMIDKIKMELVGKKNKMNPITF
jgi:hypothetical protein